MNWLQDIVHQDRSDRFVGRQEEIAAFQQWLTDNQPRTQIWDVHGIAGMGKSSLLWEWMGMAQAQHMVVLWMDGRSCPKQPASFLQYFQDALESAGMASQWPERVLWIFDNFNEVGALEGWLREDWLSRLPDQGALMVLSSRRGLDRVWYTHLGWDQRVRSFPLNALPYEEVQAYFLRMGVEDSHELQAVIQRLHGYPLGVAVVGDYFATRNHVKEAWDLSLLEQITAELLREVTDPSLHPLLDILTVLPVANHAAFQSLMAPVEVTLDQFKGISHLSFVRTVQGGITLHDVVRAQLFNFMQEYNPTGLKRLRIKAVDYLSRLYREATTLRERSHLAYQLMEISAASLPRESSYADVGALTAISRDRQVDATDAQAIHRMIDEWGRQSLVLPTPKAAHALFDAVLAQFPQAIRVIRAPDGAPIGFFVSLPMHHTTAALIELYAPGTVARYFPDETFPQDPEQADTYLGTLVGVDAHHPLYHPRDILGIIIRDGLSFLGSGLRGVVGSGEPRLKALLGLLGFESHPLGLEEGVEAFVLDMRHRDFLIWVGSVIRAFNRPVVKNRYGVDEETLRRALKAYHSVDDFNRTGLPEMLGCEGHEARRILAVLLSESPVPPLTDVTQRVLRMTFIDHIGNADRIAMALHLSRPTYYRQLRQGISDLCNVLQSGEFVAILIDRGE